MRFDDGDFLILNSFIGATTFSISTLGIMPFSIMIFFRIIGQENVTLSIMAEHCYADCHLRSPSLMLNVTNEPLMVGVIMLNVVVMNVIVLSVVAPFYHHIICIILYRHWKFRLITKLYIRKIIFDTSIL
jgi:hypothetical protein